MRWFDLTRVSSGRPLSGDGGAVEHAAEIVVVVERLIVRLIDVSPIDVIDVV